MGICWDARHVGMCVTCRDMWDMWWVICRNERWDMRDMRDGPPPRNRPVGSAVFWTAPPQSTKGGKQKRQTTSESKKRMLILGLTC